HWHGTIDDAEHEPKAGADGNFLHYVRLEAGEKRVEARRIGTGPAPHGHSYRHTPCAAAHPDGGIFVIIPRTAAPDQLVFTTIGVSPCGCPTISTPCTALTSSSSRSFSSSA